MAICEHEKENSLFPALTKNGMHGKAFNRVNAQKKNELCDLPKERKIFTL